MLTRFQSLFCLFAALLTVVTVTIAQSHEQKTGMVKWYNDEKGYGYITPDDDTPDVFFRQSALTDGVESLHGGEKVQYHLKGRQVEEVHVLSRFI